MYALAPDLGDVTDQLVGVFKDPGILIGIPLALLGAVFMSFGAQYQHRGVQKVERLTQTDGAAGLTGGQMWNLLRRPSWVAGTTMLGLAIVCQLAALSFAPLILVQPLGAVSLVLTTLLNARISGHKPTGRSLTAITLCIAGIFIFVTIAAVYATETPIGDGQIVTILVILLVIAAGLTALWLRQRSKVGPLFYIVAAGIMYGFVATLAKVVLSRIRSGDFDWLTIICIVALIAGTGIGAYFVQTAYASGPPDLVIAGLTVIDPIVAVLIGLIVLREAEHAPWGAYAGFAAAGALAVTGVFMLARFHPQVVSDSRELPIVRGSSGHDGEPRTRDEKFTDAVAKVWPDPPVRDRDPRGPR